MKFFHLFFVLAILSGCATLHLPEAVTDKGIEGLDDETTNIFLVGDAGKPDNNNDTPKALKAMQSQFKRAGKEDVLLFLGDNIYPKGLPSRKEKGYQAAKKALELQLGVAKTFPGRVIFIPGNHDWYHGLKGLKRQEKMVEKALGKNTFLPENGCPIKKVNLSDDTVLILVDSHWYVTNWDKHPTINNDCEIKTRAEFLEAFRSQIKKARGKTTLVAIHHPMFSNGPHGGQYSFKSTLKPLPVIGFLKNILRKTSGISNADMSNRFYASLRKNLLAAAHQNNQVIFLSGHEHSLQYINSQGIPQIVSGSAAKVTPLRLRKKMAFGATEHGYALLNIHKNKACDVQFLNIQNKLLFKTNVISPIKAAQTHFSKTSAKTKRATVYRKEATQKSKFYKWLWGERYRKYFSTPVQAPVAYLDTLYGGLSPVRKGGGTQSKSLRLKDKQGRQYVMRAVEKQATQYLQSALFKDQYVENQLKNTASEALVKDVFTGSHPYAPLAIPVLSDAVGVYHLNPKLFYIPKQTALQRFNTDFGDELYLLEEHASKGHNLFADDHFTGRILSTHDMMTALHADEDNSLDQAQYVRARLFDMLIGDWDRHEDQWRWLEFKINGKTVYRPLPRDRDQAFSIMSDGVLLGLSATLIPTARLLKKYSPDLKDVKGVNLEPYPLDMAFIVDADKAVWDAQVKHICKGLTDQVINEAFGKLPKEVQDETVEIIKKKLKQRRKNLQKIADRYYKVLSKYVVLTATNKDDYILVNATPEGQVAVSMYRKKGGAITDRFHHRTYDPKTTKEVWIYGLDDDDTFKVTGKIKHMKIRLIGGQNNDSYLIEQGRNVIIYDYKSKKNNTSNAQKTRLKLRDDYDTNVYNYKKLKTNQRRIFPLIGGNPDDGVKLGASSRYTTYGFERNPFSSRHDLSAAYYFATNGYEVDYRGEFANVVNHLNLFVKLTFQSPNFSQNFFGYGNETKNMDDKLGLDYNYVKVRRFAIASGFNWFSKRGSELSLSTSHETIEVHNSDNRFVSVGVLPDYLFNEVHFWGLEGSFRFSNYDNQAYPTNALLFSLKLGYKRNLNHQNGYGYLISRWNMTQSLDAAGRLVWATSLQGHLNFGDHFEFYQGAQIGGDNGLRGFRNERFVGKRAFYQSTDLRYCFNRLKTKIIPVKLGAYLGFDYGRVWRSNDPSRRWHNSFGGGIFVNGVDLLSANLGLFYSDDGRSRIAFGVGFRF